MAGVAQCVNMETSFYIWTLMKNMELNLLLLYPPQEIERLEGLDSTNPNYIQYQWNSAGMTFENWQIVIFVFWEMISMRHMEHLF